MTRISPARIAQGFYRRLKPWLFPPDRFLKECRGIIHVGANRGDERETYAKHDLTVLWIEALPNVFKELQANLEGFPKQTAIEALLTDREGDLHDFKVSDHGGVSSSIFEFSEHQELWPEIRMTGTIRLASKTLTRVLEDAARRPDEFDALILDVQGAELLVVKGAGELLGKLRFIQAEASDFEAYSGACTLATLSAFLAERGFAIRHKDRFAWKKGVGAYYNVVYERKR